MKFYRFYQNNSGGHLDKQLPHTLCVEAESAEAANVRAESIGVYFDGCESELDCDCCGDRWYRTDESSGKEYPDFEGYEWAKPHGVLFAGALKWAPVSKKAVKP